MEGCYSVSDKVLFQSLSGFLMSCNDELPRRDHRDPQVSIPIGFSNEL